MYLGVLLKSKAVLVLVSRIRVWFWMSEGYGKKGRIHTLRRAKAIVVDSRERHIQMIVILV